MADVFISYAREDRERARRLALALEAAGRSVWWDREILPGKDFTAVIGAELATAKAVVVIWSAASVASGWVRDEAHEGLERQALVPVLVDGVEPPMGFRSIHAADLTSWEGGDRTGFDDVLQAIAALCDGAAPLHEPAIVAPSPTAVGQLGRRKWMGWLAGLVLLAALAGGITVLPKLIMTKDNSDRPPVPTTGTPGTVQTFQDCSRCPTMVVLAVGEFRMGTTWLDRQSQSDERPRVAVTIGRPFALGRNEVTFDEWEACLGDGGCGGYRPPDADWGGGKRPVINVAWADVQLYLEWLRAKTGKPYRLPTEAEWEYACRAGTETNYPFGDAIGPALANYNRQVGRTQEVGSYPPNPWGLHDMNGNVWEWVEDVYNNGHGGRPADAEARTTGPDPEDHVIRGGSWDDRDRRARCASRDRKDSAHREDELGFRVALSQ
ncbi:MAG: SUMF1/EgtB/PvdO family nonheme iron enzyme [Geminicoccaceae bacterium]